MSDARMSEPGRRRARVGSESATSAKIQRHASKRDTRERDPSALSRMSQFGNLAYLTRVVVQTHEQCARRPGKQASLLPTAICVRVHFHKRYRSWGKMSEQANFGVPWLGIALLSSLLAMSEARGQAGITVVTDPATSISSTGVTLNGTVNGNGEDISAVYFDYGPTVPYDQTFQNATPFNVTAAQGQAPVSLIVGGLVCATSYHFRVTADDSNGRNAKGSDLTFSTAPCVAPRPELPVPTLSTWSLLALIGLIGVMASWSQRRSRRDS